MDRREFLTTLATAVAGLTLPLAASARPRRRPTHRPARRTVRRHVRRRVRRRIRRPVTYRTFAGKRRLVVPVAVAVGWELALDDQVVRVVAIEDDVMTVRFADGQVTDHAIHREDTVDNSLVLQGTELDADDTSSPFVEAEEDVEIEVVE